MPAAGGATEPFFPLAPAAGEIRADADADGSGVGAGLAVAWLSAGAGTLLGSGVGRLIAECTAPDREPGACSRPTATTNAMPASTDATPTANSTRRLAVHAVGGLDRFFAVQFARV